MDVVAVGALPLVARLSGPHPMTNRRLLPALFDLLMAFAAESLFRIFQKVLLFRFVRIMTSQTAGIPGFSIRLR